MNKTIVWDISSDFNFKINCWKVWTVLLFEPRLHLDLQFFKANIKASLNTLKGIVIYSLLASLCFMLILHLGWIFNSFDSCFCLMAPADRQRNRHFDYLHSHILTRMTTSISSKVFCSITDRQTDKIFTE